jgi:hypothetical protein
MAKLLSQKTAIKLLCANGWTQSVGGKHNVKMNQASLPPHHLA